MYIIILFITYIMTQQEQNIWKTIQETIEEKLEVFKIKTIKKIEKSKYSSEDFKAGKCNGHYM